ncbi:protein SRG1-like [Tripterygium wilfordii]|uniref:protein SRG1-like n=1 Tax=Tripterygium wilfordii TaxID=458696 RepID=UPI0018F81BD8|nr:protein SRG1-like [Tripterygium wilfordii]
MGSNYDDTTGDYVPTYALSIPVPNVQELARNDPLQVPDRYVQKQEDRPQEIDFCYLSSDIPVIDLSLLSNGDEEQLKKLDKACKEWGFFQVVNHGVDKEVLCSMKGAASEFFELPLQEKNKYSMPSDDIQGYGHAYVVSEEQLLDWSDALILAVYPSQYRKLKFWPKSPKGLSKGMIEEYSNGVKKVAEELLRSLSSIMGMEKDRLLEMHKQLVQAMRINYYPACCRPDQVLGISAHSDTSTLTILMQENDITGLQIKHNGEWVAVRPIPDALVVNVGDVIEFWSNGEYKSIEHRAVTNKSKARISYATFFFPHDDVEIEPLDHMESSTSPHKMYKRVKYGDHLRSSMKRRMEGKAHTEMAKTGKT